MHTWVGRGWMWALLGACVGCGGPVAVLAEPPSELTEDSSGEQRRPPGGIEGVGLPVGPGGVPRQAWVLPELQAGLPHYELTIPEETLALFHADVWTSERPATFEAEGQTWQVQVRLRGRSSRFWDKKSWRVELPAGQTLHGERRLNLVAMVQDSTMMVEKLAFDLLGALGAPAPRAKFVRLTLNGQYEGVFLQIQHVDKHFLKAHRFLDFDADIYRCGTHDCEMKLFRQSYQGPWVKKTNKALPSTGLDEFLRLVNRTPEPDLAQILPANLELDRFLSSMTVDALISNFTVEDSGSYLVFDRATGKWTYVPWDYNNANSRFWPTYGLTMKPLTGQPLFPFSLTDKWLEKRYQTRVGRPEFPDYLPAFSNLNTRVAFNPTLRGELLDKLERALDELFREDLLSVRIDQMHALIDAHMKADPYIDYERFSVGPAYLKAYVKGRAAFLRSEIARYRADVWQPLVISAFDPQQGWVELTNRSGSSQSTAGRVITTDLRRALHANIPAHTLAPGQTVRFYAAQLGLAFGPQGELGLFDGTSVLGAEDVLFYDAPPEGMLYRRGAGGWQFADR
jgi:spore coat protein H